MSQEGIGPDKTTEALTASRASFSSLSSSGNLVSTRRAVCRNKLHQHSMRLNVLHSAPGRDADYMHVDHSMPNTVDCLPFAQGHDEEPWL